MKITRSANLFRFQIKDDIKAAMSETARRTFQYVEQSYDEPTKIGL